MGELKLDRWFVRRKRYNDMLLASAVEVDRLMAINNATHDAWDAIDDDLTDAQAKIVALETKATPAKQKVTKEEFDRLSGMRCSNCGGVHTIACPRVKRMRFRPDGTSPAETEFWRADEWPKDDVVWLENLELEKPLPN